MSIKTVKFGGSSVADGIQLQKMKRIIEADADRRYVIVSAPGKRFSADNKITDLLYLVVSQKENNIPYDQVFEVITDRYTAIASNLDIDIDLGKYYDEIRANIDAGACADYVVSRGEYLSALLVSAYLGYDFVDAEGRILFDERGRVDLDATDRALGEELKKHERAVIPGFYGSNAADGTIRIFSRGGSDITGALVSRAIGADVYENWTDVSGFLMADPKIVDDPKPIGSISYMELRELSYMGASVLHEDAIYPVRLSDIPINIRNTNKPDDVGTMITAEHDPNDKRVITGIAGNKDFTVISLYKNELNKERGYIRKMLSIIENNDISFEHIPTGIDTVSIVISNESLDGKLDDVIDAFKVQLKPDSIDVSEEISLIATVGYGMSHRPGTSAALFGALAKNDINIRMIDQSTREMNIIVGVDTKDFEKAIRAIYAAFSEE